MLDHCDSPKGSYIVSLCSVDAITKFRNAKETQNVNIMLKVTEFLFHVGSALSVVLDSGPQCVAMKHWCRKWHASKRYLNKATSQCKNAFNWDRTWAHKYFCLQRCCRSQPAFISRPVFIEWRDIFAELFKHAQIFVLWITWTAWNEWYIGEIAQNF